jgi:hypothetical protein
MITSCGPTVNPLLLMPILVLLFNSYAPMIYNGVCLIVKQMGQKKKKDYTRVREANDVSHYTQRYTKRQGGYWLYLEYISPFRWWSSI